MSKTGKGRLKRVLLGESDEVLEVGNIQFIVKNPSHPDRPQFRHLFKDCSILVRWNSEVKEITDNFKNYPLCPFCKKRFGAY